MTSKDFASRCESPLPETDMKINSFSLWKQNSYDSPEFFIRHHFENIIKLREFLYKTDDMSLVSALRRQLYPGWYVWVTSSRAQDKAGKIVPIDLGSYLYRGQTNRYCPCIPSIFRNNESNSYHKLTSLMKLAEFRLLCLTHPGVKQCIELGLDVDFIGLAQHYGLSSNYLDLTQDIDIACFFAVSELIEDGLYRPCKKGGVGVIYRVRHSHAKIANRIVLIGKQPFVRPEKQKAWALEMKESEDLEKFAGIEVLTFDHTEVGSTKIWEQFKQQLFPQDIMADKAKKLIKSDTIYKGILDKDLEDILSNTNFVPKLSDRPSVELTPDELKALSLYWEDHGRGFLSKVGSIFVANGTKELSSKEIDKNSSDDE